MEILLPSCYNRTLFSYYTKKTYRAFLIIILFIIIITRPAICIGQSPSAVQVTSTNGSGASGLYYATLGTAFVAINNGVHTGTVLVSILDNTTEGGAAVLNASGSGNANYTSVNIQPSGGATRTISGDIAGALIDLNGADNITFDGLNTDSNALVIDNQNLLTASTMQIRADATSVTIKKCTVKGAGNNLGATILVSAANTLGNDNFWVDDCDITASSTGNPVNGLLFNSITTDNTKVTNCRISDFYSNLDNTYGIRIISLGTGCDITGNSFYQTASRNILNDLYFIGAISNAVVNNLNISNNYFGGQTLNGGSSGAPLKLSGSGALKGISLVIGFSNTASLQNNQIKNISLTTTGSNILMSLATGNFNCGNIVGNIIGSGITGVNGDLTGISAGTGTPQIINISNNTINGITNAAAIKGIVVGGTGTTYTIDNNSIYNLNISLNGSNLTGILLNSATPVQSISKNTIYDLQTAGSGDVIGIDYNSGGTNTIIRQNKIYNLTSTNTTYGMTITGINVAPSSNKVATFSNNMVILGNSVSKRIKIYGISEATSVGCNYYNNSIYIDGIATPNSGTVYNSVAFYSTNAINTLNIKNNIFANMRTNSSSSISGTHYSIQLSANPNLTIDNNLYFGNTTSGSGYKVGKITSDYPNFCDWQAAMDAGKEKNSLFKNPKFVNPSASIPDLHIQSTTPVESKGVAITGMTTDFDGDPRSSIPDIGADEGNFTLEPQVSFVTLNSPVCTSAASITLLGSPSGGVFSGLGVSGATFTPSVAGSGIVTITYTYNNGVDICNVSTTQNLTVTLCETRLAAKVLIEGAYNPTTGLMNDGLRTVTKIPENQPYNTLIFAGSMAYNGSEKVAPSVFTTTDKNAIVDWVLIELRSATDRSIVVQRRAALLQRDGDIVDIDGFSPVKFDDLADGNYHLVIRHRLCLATRTKMTVSMTAQPIVTQNPTVVDFSTTNNFLSGSQKEIVTGKYGLIIGDTDRDGQINRQDINNIRAYNPSTYDSFDYLTIGYDIDFNGYVFSRDVPIVVLNNLLIQVDLGQ